MRSQHGRRFRDLAALVIAEHGPDIYPVKIRELAGLKLSIEITQAALVNGDRKARNASPPSQPRQKRAMRDRNRHTPAADDLGRLTGEIAASSPDETECGWNDVRAGPHRAGAVCFALNATKR
jgi:hypothetical protein